MENVLFLTDFSMNSIHAIRYGLNLFESEKQNFFLYHAYSYKHAEDIFSNDILQQIKRNSELKIEAVKRMLKENYGHKNLNIQTIVEFGYLPASLDIIIEKNKIDMIIMGSSGNSLFNLNLFGSKTYEVMQHVNIPVLSVPMEIAVEKPQQFGIATEKHLEPWESSLDTVTELAQKINAQVIGIHVNVGNREAVLEPSQSFENDFNIAYLDIESPNKLLGIRNAIGEGNIDLLVLLRKQRNFLDKIFHRSLSKQILSKIDVPILILND